MPIARYRRILALGDVHAPWASQPVLGGIYRAISELKPDLVIQVGDLYDYYTASRYPTDPNVTKPQDEFAEGRRAAVGMWAEIRRRAPKAKRIQIKGNHDDRPSKRLAEATPALKHMAELGFREMFAFDGVETHHDSADELFLDSAVGTVCFMHGHRSRLGDHARFNQMSTVTGHSHTGGVVMLRNRHGPYWELNAGWCGDEKAAPFRYGAQRRIKSWTTGFGLIDAYGPRFCPLKG